MQDIEPELRKDQAVTCGTPLALKLFVVRPPVRRGGYFRPPVTYRPGRSPYGHQESGHTIGKEPLIGTPMTSFALVALRDALSPGTFSCGICYGTAFDCGRRNRRPRNFD